MTNSLETIMNYAINCHESTNHRYDGKSYYLHLKMVVDVASEHIELISKGARTEVLAACWCHDVIEDCRQTYNDVKEIAGGQVAEMVYAVTNEKGRSRKERANTKYYEGIKLTPFATFIKLCDRIANVRYSKEKNSRMFDMYMKENDEFLGYLHSKEHYKPLVDELNNLFPTN